MKTLSNPFLKNSDSSIITKHQIVVFLIVTVVISFLVYLWFFLGGGESPEKVIAMMWTPVIAAGITSLLLKIKLSPYGWRKGKLLFWGYGYLLPVIVALIGYGIMWITGVTEFYTDEVINYRWARMLGFDTPAPFIAGFFSKLFLASLVTSVAVLGEEIGWSAFLTPRMVKIYSVPTTSIIIGLIWAVWHFPAIISGSYGHGAPLWAALPGFTLALIGASFFRTVLILRAGSFWPGIIIHTSHNVVLMGIFNEMTVKTEISPFVVSESGLFLGLIYLLIGIVFWLINKKQL